MKLNSKWIPWALLIAVVTCIFFLPVLQGEFLHWDDRALYVENPYYTGLSAEHWRWMCITFHFGHWQPLTWLSCALDYKVWKLNAAGWHATNLLLHAMNAVLVYLLCLAFFRELRGRYAAAAMAALFWAIHPLRVEAVAWLSTRGYLLCGTFCLLTVLFYLRAVERKHYPLGALFCFALATFTKGIGMMLPLVLLLIDGIPLRRINSMRAAGACAVEKIPFFALSMVTGVTAFLAKRADGGMAPIELYEPVQRIGQAIYGIWFYLLKIVSPLRLLPLYGKQPELWQVVSALIVSIAAGIFLFLFRRKVFPIIGTFGAFLLLIFPMLGFTQSGVQLFADRFTYLASVPFSVLLTVGLTRLSTMRRAVYGTLAALLLIFGIQSMTYSNLWGNEMALWSYAVNTDDSQSGAQGSLGLVLMESGRFYDALIHLKRAIELNPDNAVAMHISAMVLASLQRYDEALSQWRNAFEIPVSNRVRWRMELARGWVLEQTGELSAAEADYASVADNIQAEPLLRSRGLQMRAVLRIKTGRTDQAVSDLIEILHLPDTPDKNHSKARFALEVTKKSPGRKLPEDFLLIDNGSD